MSRFYFFAASVMLAIGALVCGPEWFAKTLKEIGKDL